MSANKGLLELFAELIGKEYVLVSHKDTKPYRQGYRQGQGSVLCVLRPGSLLELWRCFKLAIKQDLIVITQAQNTGLTGGSTPWEEDEPYERLVVVISTLRINTIHLLNKGSESLAYAGATLFDLEKQLDLIGREAHSVLGSSSVGACVAAGVANNSGGALCKRGPAYTQMALFAKVEANGECSLINHLGIELGEDEEEILQNLDKGIFDKNPKRPKNKDGFEAKGSDSDYAGILQDVTDPSPSRYNNNPRQFYEASGCAGKLLIFALRLDTFPRTGAGRIFYLGANSSEELTTLRRELLAKTLPVAMEYMHKDLFDIGLEYGKWTFRCLEIFGSEKILKLFAIKRKFEALCQKIGIKFPLANWGMNAIFKLTGKHLPSFMYEYREKYEHYLIIHAQGDEALVEDFLKDFCKDKDMSFLVVSDTEGQKAFRHRYSAAGAALQYCSLHEKDIGGLVDLDIALPRGLKDFDFKLPASLKERFLYSLNCGHFACFVLHQDYILKKGYDLKESKKLLVEFLENLGAKCPSEHNVGHVYAASSELENFYKELDPTNSLNPGIGKTSKRKFWA